MMQELDVELFGVAVMSRAEVAKYNQQAHKVGRHLCPTCLQEFEHTEEYFYRQSMRKSGKVGLHNDCRACDLEKRKADLNQRYHSDAAFRERVLERQRKRMDNMSATVKELRRKKNRKYQIKYQQKRLKRPFDPATLGEVDLQAITRWDVIWINKSLEGRRVCVDCREIKRLTVVNFRVYGKRRGSPKAYQLHVCRECEKARRGEE